MNFKRIPKCRALETVSVIKNVIYNDNPMVIKIILTYYYLMDIILDLNPKPKI